jgi:hypothetical protein
VEGEQLLVRGDDVAPGAHRAQDVVARRLDAADHLDDEVGALDDLLEGPARAREDARQLGPQPGGQLDLLGARLQQRGERRPDGAVPEQADTERPRLR